MLIYFQQEIWIKNCFSFNSININRVNQIKDVLNSTGVRHSQHLPRAITVHLYSATS